MANAKSPGGGNLSSAQFSETGAHSYLHPYQEAGETSAPATPHNRVVTNERSQGGGGGRVPSSHYQAADRKPIAPKYTEVHQGVNAAAPRKGLGIDGVTAKKLWTTHDEVSKAYHKEKDPEKKAELGQRIDQLHHQARMADSSGALASDLSHRHAANGARAVGAPMKGNTALQYNLSRQGYNRRVQESEKKRAETDTRVGAKPTVGQLRETEGTKERLRTALGNAAVSNAASRDTVNGRPAPKYGSAEEAKQAKRAARRARAKQKGTGE